MTENGHSRAFPIFDFIYYLTKGREGVHFQRRGVHFIFFVEFSFLKQLFHKS